MRSVALVQAFRRSPLEFLTALRAAGAAQAPLRIGPERVLLLDDPGEVWTLLTTHARGTVKGRGLARARVLLGDGLLTSEGITHQRHRRTVQEAFRPNRIADYRTAFTAAARRTSRGWSDGGRVDLVAEMSAMTLDAVGTALFGAEVRHQAPRVGSALSDLFVGFRLAMVPGGLALLRSPLPVARRVRRAQADLDSTLDDLIAGHRAGPRHTVIELLGSDPRLSEREVREEILTLLLAGHETTAMALSWALAAIDAAPTLRADLEREWSGGDAELPLTSAVVAETMRLWPPSWLISRRLREPITLGGRRLPAGLMCLVSPALLHRDERWWTDPEEFRPERWLRPVPDTIELRYDARGPGHPRGAYLPFGAGPRMCIGEQFARIEAATMLAELGRHWRVRLLDGPLVPGPSSMTLRPRGVVRAATDHRS